MKKKFKYFVITWSVLFALFNIVIFVTPNQISGITRFDKPIFWITYIFILLSLVGQLLTTLVVSKSDNMDKLFLNMPFLSLGYVMITCSVILGLAFMIVTVIPTWIGIIVCSLTLGCYIFTATKLKAGFEIISEIETNVSNKTNFYKMAMLNMKILYNNSKNTEAEKNIKDVYDELKYGSSISNEFVKEIESEINIELEFLKEELKNSKYDEIKTHSNKLLSLVKERNEKCKIKE